MRAVRFAAALTVVGAMVVNSGTACAQSYPSKPVRIVTSEPGGSADFAARLVVQGLAAGNFGQPAVVDNRANAIIAAQTAAQAPPDGYTLLLYGSAFWVGPLLQSTSYDPVRDFSPITLAARAPNLLVVHPSLPVKSVKELIALAKAKPRELNYAAGSIGASTHLAAELFKSMAGVDIVLIPYKGGGPAIIALLSGQVQLTFATAAAVATHVKSGKLRALAVTSAKPSALVPGLPPVAAAVPGYEASVMIGIFAPAKTGDAVIRLLNQEMVRVLTRPDVKDKLFNAGVEAVGSSPEECAATVKADMALLGKVIKDAGIRIE